MGKPLMIQEDDERRIDLLKERIGLRSKVDVVRAGLALLEKEEERRMRVARWKRAAGLAARQSEKINMEFQKHSPLKRL